MSVTSINDLCNRLEGSPPGRRPGLSWEPPVVVHWRFSLVPDSSEKWCRLTFLKYYILMELVLFSPNEIRELASVALAAALAELELRGRFNACVHINLQKAPTARGVEVATFEAVCFARIKKSLHVGMLRHLVTIVFKLATLKRFRPPDWLARFSPVRPQLVSC